MAEYRNFPDIINRRADKHPEDTFIYDVHSRRSYSFGEFNRIVRQTAVYLISLGVRQGDRVTAVIRNSPEYCFFYFGTLRAAAVFNPMPYSSHRQEVIQNIKVTEPRLLLIDEGRTDDFADFDDNIKPLLIPVGADRQFERQIESVKEQAVDEVEIDDGSAACLYYSSGTTADPKGVMVSHRNMVANISSICRGFRFKEQGEIHLIILPLGHTASINYSLLPCAYSGGKIVLTDDFWHIRRSFWELVEAHRVTYVETVPTVLFSLLNLYRTPPENDLSSLPYVGCGSAPLPKSIQEQFQERFKLKVANLYGLSETGPTHIDNPLAPGWEPGSIGVPLDVNEAGIVGEDGREMKANEIGEIVIKGDNVFTGYFKNEDLYRQVVRHGYFHTGDLGYRDESGVFYFVDRKKDLIIKGGINIVPAEIDEVLMRHPAVKEAVTIGIPDKWFGEDIKSFVVFKDGVRVSIPELLDHCRRFLSRNRIPRQIEPLREIPKTHSGKLLRKKLREQTKE